MYLVDILARCSDIESRMAKVYRKLSEHFRDGGEIANLWRELALEEETHADVLRRELRDFEEEGDSGAFMPEYADRLQRADRALGDLERQAGTLKSLDEATALSVALEQAALEDLYDDLVVQGPPAFKLLCERIEHALSERPAINLPGLPRRQRLARRPSTTP
jgi:hypothetical protein